jgi:16S rRNA processing protein RimM
MEKKLAVGKITATHGLRGEVKVVSFSGEVAHLRTLESLELMLRGELVRYGIEYIRGSEKKIILKLAGIDSIDEAAGLTGSELWVDREDASKLEEEEYYFADLCGCSVDCSGKEYGSVVSVCEGAHNELLEVALHGGGTVFIPFREVYVGVIDIEKKRIEVIEDWFFQ